jgi:lipoprotein-anchoring transpeptidase ErfK/SrfK
MRKIDGKVASSLGVALLASVAASSPCWAQGLPFWADELFGTGRGRLEPRRDFELPQRREPRWGLERGAEPRDLERGAEPRRDPERGGRSVLGGDVRDGGPRPQIAPVAPATVAFDHEFPVHSIVIDTGARALYFVLPDKRAYRYPISVGREGFNWTGTENISRKQAWPDWYPPAEMRERDASLPEKMTGGLKNPLGAMALYLGNTLYRIHGTNDVKSIGQAQSSGCFRMLNGAVMHLASLAEVGTAVSVVDHLPARQEVSRAAPPSPAPGSGQAQSSSAPSAPSAAPPEPLPNYSTLRDYALQRR